MAEKFWPGADLAAVDPLARCSVSAKNSATGERMRMTAAARGVLDRVVLEVDRLVSAPKAAHWCSQPVSSASLVRAAVGPLQVRADLTKSDEGLHGAVVLLTPGGVEAARLEGYRIAPAADYSAVVGESRDDAQLTRSIQRFAPSSAPAAVLARLPGLQARSRTERKLAEWPYVVEAVRRRTPESAARPLLFFSWDSGQPGVAGPGAEGADLTLSHDEEYLLVVVGDGPLGCDLETLVDRDAETWRGMLGDDNFQAARHLVRVGDDLQLAATRVWAAGESIFKATGGEFQGVVERRGGAAVHLRDRASNLRVLTFPTRLKSGQAHVVALVV